MSSKTTESSKPRITFTLGEFDEMVILKMAKKREVSKSEIVRNLIHNWIENNHDILKRDYEIKFKEITEELRKDLDDLDKEVINQLPELFETISSISAKELAEILNINENTLKRIIFGYRQELLKVGLTFKYENGLFLKE